LTYNPNSGILYANMPIISADAKKKGLNTMRVAVTYENGQIFQHFGHCAQFALYDIENGEIVSSQVVDTNGAGHGALAGFLKNAGADVLICGGIGGGAQMAMAEAGIKLYAGNTGSADAAVKMLISGSFLQITNATCDHHGHGEDHSCGSHSCGGH
jgi:predicted Fe-Mo cluster-binding NifX family protein